MAARFAKLTKAWQNLKLSKSRQAKGMPWLRWEEEEERECEPGAQALTFNCQMVRLMVEHLQQLTLVSIDLLQKVEQFYENQGWDVTPSRIYKDSWGLRKLYSYALRREADCHKRGQTPAGEAVQKLFELIRELRNTRLQAKTAAAEEEVLFVGSSETKEKKDNDKNGPKEADLVDPQMQRSMRSAKKILMVIVNIVSNMDLDFSQVGFMLAVILKLKPGSIIHARSIDGYEMADKLALALFLAQALGFTWTAELPSSGLLQQHPRKHRLRSNSRAILVFHPARLAKKSSVYVYKIKIYCRMFQKGTFQKWWRPGAWFSKGLYTMPRKKPKANAAKAVKEEPKSIEEQLEDARQLLKSLEARREQEQLTTPADDLEEAEEPPSKKPRLRKKKSKRGLERVVDKGEDAQDVWGFDTPGYDSPTEGWDTKEGFDTKGFDTKGFDTQGFDTQALDTQHAPEQTPKKATPRKSLLSSFDEACAEPPAEVLTLPAPRSDSENEDDNMLQYALHNMIEVSSAEEDKDIYGTPLKVTDTPTADEKDAVSVDNLSKEALSKLEATLRRCCKPDRKGGLKVPEQVHKMWKRGGSSRRELRKVLLECDGKKELFTQKVKHTYTQSRKDKYQKKLIWYYCDIAYEAVRSDKDEEQMSRETGLGEASVSDVALGLGASLPNLNSDDEDDVEAEDDDEDEKDEDAEEGTQPTAKLGKRKTKEGLNDVNEDRFSNTLQQLCNPRIAISDPISKKPKTKADLLKSQIKELGVKHDELADMKSAYDCDEEIDSGKLTKLMGQINKLSSRMAMEENKIKKSLGCQISSYMEVFLMLSCYKVSHELVAGVARAVESEINESFGEEAAAKLKSYRLLCKMSRGHLTGHAAQKTRDALATMPESQAPIPVTGVDVGLKQLFPCILFSDYLRVLADQNKLNVLTKDVNLEAFWDKMQPLRPQHPIFQLPASARACTIPLYLIGDEGRGYKKSAVFVLGSESLLGDGCDAQDSQTAEDKMKMNFVGNTFLTRQLFACMPKYLYAKKDLPLHKLINIWAEDFAKLFYDGLEIRSGGCTQTWRVSLWDFKLTGSDARGLDKNLEFLFQEMKQFSADRGLYLHMNNLTAKGLLGISSSADFPVGQWFKGADTTFVLKFLIWKYEALQESGALEGHSEAEYLGQILECLRASDGFLSCLYKAGLFLNKRRLIKVCRLATAMVTLYTQIAAMAHSRSLPRFKLTPKYHMLMHVVHQLLVDKEANRSPVNPLAYSCQMPEDFINRIATLARSVNPRFVPERTLYLYKVALAKVWE
ncbi:STRN3 [Symbiodinium sp. CCMP2592]|nr:STRN3 [Symbiodinium sp. CCMP2592]